MIKVSNKCRIKMSNMGFARCIVNWARDETFFTFRIYQTLISRNQKPNTWKGLFQFWPIPKYHSENIFDNFIKEKWPHNMDHILWCLVKLNARSLIKTSWCRIRATVICLFQCRIVRIKIIMIFITFKVQYLIQREFYTLKL